MAAGKRTQHRPVPPERLAGHTFAHRRHVLFCEGLVGGPQPGPERKLRFPSPREASRQTSKKHTDSARSPATSCTVASSSAAGTSSSTTNAMSRSTAGYRLTWPGLPASPGGVEEGAEVDHDHCHSAFQVVAVGNLGRQFSGHTYLPAAGRGQARRAG